MGYEHRLQRILHLILVVLAVPVAAGCAPKYQDLQAFIPAQDHDVAATRYRVEPPDVITISSPTAPEIDGVTQLVGVDGKITLNLLGEVKVSQLTPREISSKLEGLLRTYYVDPKVHVRVTGYHSKHVYVFGQVGGAGPYPFTGRDTVLDMIAQARPTFIAWGGQVKVIRPSASSDERREVVVDVDRMTKSGDLRGNFLLQEGDIIYVPPTPLGWVGLRMHELLFPIAPALAAYSGPGQVAQTNRILRDGF